MCGVDYRIELVFPQCGFKVEFYVDSLVDFENLWKSLDASKNSETDIEITCWKGTGKFRNHTASVKRIDKEWSVKDINDGSWLSCDLSHALGLTVNDFINAWKGEKK